MQRITSARRIAIIGAGGTGSCAALELAARGHSVDLYERCAEPISQASFANEGKVHLGYIYAKDRSLRTAAYMIEGALEFAETLRRWIPFDASDVVSTPFLYCVHRGSLMEPGELAGHYRRCGELHQQLAHERGLDYLGLGGDSRTERLHEADYSDRLDPAYIRAVFSTPERAVDPHAVADQLRKALAAEPRVRLHTEHEVTHVGEDRRGGLWVRTVHRGEVSEERHSDVLNTSWYGRLPLDRQMGIVPPGRWLHRYKFANRIRVPLRADQLPSCTCVQGPFGDIVNFGERGLFLSWYPIGCIGMSGDETPPDWDAELGRELRMDVFARSFAAWRERCGELAGLEFGDEDVQPDGGVIYALGDSDIDDAGSRLHDRFEIGIQSRGRYHTVDTGKFTLVPYWGRRAADRLEGLDG